MESETKKVIDNIHYLVNEWFQRGQEDCILDMCENVPFASTGGLEHRSQLKTPKWVPTGGEQEFDYLDGYITQAELLYGSDWQTCEFGWQKALRIETSE